MKIYALLKVSGSLKPSPKNKHIVVNKRVSVDTVTWKREITTIFKRFVCSPPNVSIDFFPFNF